MIMAVSPCPTSGAAARQNGFRSPPDSETTYRKWAYGLLWLAVLFAVLPTGLSWNFDFPEDMAEGSWIRKLQWMSLFALALFLAWKANFRYLTQFLWGNVFLWMLVVFSTLSLLWSPVPVNAFRQVVQFFGVLLVCYVVSVYTLKDLSRIFEQCFDVLMAVLVMSIVTVVVDPVQGKESVAGIQGAWRGILEQKNTLGIASGVALLLWAYVQTTRPRKPLLAFSSLLVIVVCLLGSRSSSSLFFGLSSVCLYGVLYKDHVRASMLFVRVILVLLAALILLNLVFFFYANRAMSFSDIVGPFSGLFGKSSDLTGRADIWLLMWQSISQHWLLGTGFASFWLGPGGPSQFISDTLQWTVPTAHNGYLEILNEIGLIGAALFVGMLVSHIKNIISIFGANRHQAALHLSVLLVFLISNFSESTALKVTSFLQFLLFVSMMSVQAANIHAQPLWSDSRQEGAA